jgi:hypothetical protein
MVGTPPSAAGWLIAFNTQTYTHPTITEWWVRRLLRREWFGVPPIAEGGAMKRFILMPFIVLLCFGLLRAEETSAKKTILLISEQNIEGPQRAWWASEIDLSTTEAAIAKAFIASGLEVLEPSNMTQVIKQDRAFRMVDLSEDKSVKLGNLSKADYVVLGKAIASAGGNVPQSSMRSCFANITAKLIRVKDGKVIAYLDSAGNSAHMDVITGGREALANAGSDLAAKLIDALNKEGGK